MQTLNPIDDARLHGNLELFLKVLMKDFPKSFESMLNKLASPEKPVFVMTNDETKFISLEVSVEHLATSKLAVEVRKVEPVLMNDEVSMIWMKFVDPEQKVNDILIKYKEVVFNDEDRDERYYATESTVTNLTYSRRGDAILTIFPRTPEGIARYKESANLAFNSFVDSMLDGIKQ